MIWGAMFYKKTNDLVGIEGIEDTQYYHSILEHGLLYDVSLTLQDG